MILISPDQRLFHLLGKTFSYVLYIDDEGRLLDLYWKDPLGETTDLAYLCSQYTCSSSFDQPATRLPLEAPSVGGGYYGTPLVQAIGPDGTDMTQLTYDSYQVVEGKPALEGLPSLHESDRFGQRFKDDAPLQTLKITLSDKTTGLKALLSYTIVEAGGRDGLAKSMVLTNQGPAPLLLTHMDSACAYIPDAASSGESLEVVHLKGAWARERNIVRTPLGQGTYRIDSKRGASSHEENPFLALCRPSATEVYGSVWSAGLIYSGSFEAACYVPDAVTAQLSIGLNSDTTRWLLEPGQSFTTPEALLVYSGRGFGQMSHTFHDLFRHCLGHSRWQHKERPILINSWEAAYFTINEEKCVQMAKTAASMGIELFVLDDGWFGARNDDTSSLGDWYPNLQKFPHGIKGLAERVNKAGTLFGLWVEPEMISPNSDLCRAHPDWCLHAGDRKRTLGRNQLILDLSRTEVQDYIIGFMTDLLSSASISYIKWDMNRNMTEPFSGTQVPQHQLETQHRYMLGLYRVLDTITSAFPDVLFESCSGGGGRFDAGLLAYMPQAWASDDTDARERLKIQYGTSLVYPCYSMGSHISSVPNHQVNRVTPLKTRAAVAMSGSFGLELNLLTMTEEERKEMAAWIGKAKEYRRLIMEGDFDRLASPFDDKTYTASTNLCAWQFSNDSELLLMAFRPQAEPSNAMPYRVYPRGLEDDAYYSDGTHTYLGRALAGAGLVLTFDPTDTACVIVYLKKINKD